MTLLMTAHARPQQVAAVVGMLKESFAAALAASAAGAPAVEPAEELPAQEPLEVAAEPAT